MQYSAYCFSHIRLQNQSASYQPHLKCSMDAVTQEAATWDSAIVEGSFRHGHWSHPQGFWFGGSGVGPENLNIYPAPRRC